MFTADPTVDHSRVTRLFQQKVTAEMNDSLCRNFSDEEIADALFQIGPLKAPGPDGFPARFYQRNWGLIKSDVVRGVRNSSLWDHADGINRLQLCLFRRLINQWS